jgi:MtN3 and saliva related transmembrane protein
MNPVLLGLIAGAFTTCSSLPQIFRVIKTRSMNDISLVTLCMFAFGVSLWLCYGIIIQAVPVIIWNSLSLTLYCTQILLKINLTNPDALPFSRFAPRGEPVPLSTYKIALRAVF